MFNTVEISGDLPTHTHGDLNANYNLLKRSLIRLGYSNTFDSDKVLQGNINELVHIYRWILLQYDSHVTQYITAQQYIIQSSNNTRVLETIYKICRDLLHIYPTISTTQYCTLTGYAEHKIIVLSLFAHQIYVLHKALKQKLHNTNKRRPSTANISQRLYTPAKVDNKPTHATSSTTKRPITATARHSNAPIRRMSRSMHVHHQQDNAHASRSNSLHQLIPIQQQSINMTQSIFTHPVIVPHSEPTADITTAPQDTSIQLLSNKLDDILSRVLSAISSIDRRVTAVEQRLDHINADQHIVLQDSTSEFVNQLNQRLKTAQQQLSAIKTLPVQVE